MGSPPNIPEDMLDRAVNAMLEAQRAQLRSALSDSPVDPKALEKFFLDLTVESDRAIAIVAFAYIDHLLKTLMAGDFRGDIEGGAKALFRPFGPLSSANARIKIAGALGWLASNTYANLEVLRRIRNEFAHAPFLRSLGSDKLAGLLARLSPLEAEPLQLADPKWVLRPDPPVKLTFISRAAILAAAVVCQVGTAPTAIRMGLPPGTALGPNLRENAPPWVYPVMKSGLQVATTLLLIRREAGKNFGA